MLNFQKLKYGWWKGEWEGEGDHSAIDGGRGVFFFFLGGGGGSRKGFIVIFFSTQARSLQLSGRCSKQSAQFKREETW